MSLKFSQLRIGQEWSGKIYPDGSFGVTRRTLRTPTKTHDPLSHLSPEERSWNCRRLRVHGLSTALSFTSESHESHGETEGGEAETLGLSNVSKPHSPSLESQSHPLPGSSGSKLPRGSHGLSAYGRRLVRGAISLLENSSPRHCLSFLTLTLPVMTRVEEQAVVAQWNELLRKAVQSISRVLKKHRLPALSAGAVELQENRQAVHGGVLPHLHLVFQGRKSVKSSWVISPEWIRVVWTRAIERIIGRTFAPQETSAVENLVMVRKSAARYLSKYLSKGIKAVTAITEGCDINHIPRCWYTVSFELRQRWKRQIVTINADLCRFLMQLCFEGDRDILVYGHVVRLEAYGNVPIGCGGVLRDWKPPSA